MVYFELKSMKLKEDPVILLGAEPKDICPVCKLIFNSRQDMESHFNRFIDELSYDCDVCNMSFHGNAQLELHKQHKHSTQHNEKLPFQCDTCNEKFSQKRMQLFFNLQETRYHLIPKEVDSSIHSED